MTFLTLQPLSVDLLPAALALDQRCFGGLWTLDGYRRELESPNSELLVLVEESEARLRRERSAEQRSAEQRSGFDVELRRNAERSQKPGAGAQESKAAVEPGSRVVRETQLKALSPPHTAYTLHPTPLLGLGCYWAILEEAHITMLAIDPAHQRQGLGQALLYSLMASAHDRGLERATLEVRLSNHAALSLYQKFDFREAGRRQRYYPDNGEDALVLWRGGLQTPEFSEHLEIWQQQVIDRLREVGWQSNIGTARP